MNTKRNISFLSVPDYFPGTPRGNSSDLVSGVVK